MEYDPERRRQLRSELVVLNQPVAHAIAARYRGRGVSEEDLLQVACEGLIKAVDRFDPAHSANLLTFAVPTIRGEVQRYFRDVGWMMRPPRRIQELQGRMSRAVSEQGQRLGRDPDRTELIAALGVDGRLFDEAQAAYGAFHLASLDRPLSTHHADGGSISTRTGSSGSLGDVVANQDGGFEAVEDREMLSQTLGVLTHRERRIVYLRFWKDLKQRDIGDELGITQMQVSRLLAQIMDKLRREMADDVTAFSAQNGWHQRSSKPEATASGPGIRLAG